MIICTLYKSPFPELDFIILADVYIFYRIYILYMGSKFLFQAFISIDFYVINF